MLIFFPNDSKKQLKSEQYLKCIITKRFLILFVVVRNGDDGVDILRKNKFNI